MAQPVATDPAVAETPTRQPSPSLDDLVRQFMDNVKVSSDTGHIKFPLLFVC